MLMVALGGVVAQGCVYSVGAEEGPLTGLIFSLCSGKFVWDAMEWMTSSATLFSRTTSGPSTTSEKVSVYMVLESCVVWQHNCQVLLFRPCLCVTIALLMFLIIFSTFFAALCFSPFAHGLFLSYESACINMTHMLSISTPLIIDIIGTFSANCRLKTCTRVLLLVFKERFY